MYTATNNAIFQEELDRGNRQYNIQLQFTFTDSSTLTIDNTRILEGGLEWSDACSEENSFEIGGCVIGELNVRLKNSDRAYNNTEFEGASVKVSIGLSHVAYIMEDGEIVRTETIESTFVKGHYIVEKADYEGWTVSLYCVDGISLLDKPFSGGFLGGIYPVEVADKAIRSCGLIPAFSTSDTENFPQGAIYACSAFEITDDDNITCREIVGDIAALYGMFVIMNADGKVEFRRYQRNGTQAATFRNDMTNLANSMKSIYITGIIGKYERADEELTAIEGSDEYAITMEDNKMFDYVNVGRYVTLVAGRFQVGTTMPFMFRPFDITHLSDPRLQVGDRVAVYDIVRQEYFTSYITNLTFNASQFMRSSCGAESNQQSGSTRYSSAAKNKAAMKTYVKSNTDHYKDYVRNYAQLMTNGFGLYLSEREDPFSSGASIFWLHDKENFEDSLFAMCFSADGLKMLKRATVNDEWVIQSASTSDGEAFYEVLYSRLIEADKVETKDLVVEVEHSATFGKFAFTPRLDGSLMFVKVGE